MATSKLTLSIDAETIKWAKKYVEKRKVSLSKFIQQRLNEIAREEMHNTALMEKFGKLEIPEDINSLTGILQDTDLGEANLNNIKYQYFKEKHGL